MDAALEAERARDAEVGLLSNRNADYAELSARVLEFDEENGLLREQTGEMATELRRLTVDLEARARRCASSNANSQTLRSPPPSSKAAAGSPRRRDLPMRSARHTRFRELSTATRRAKLEPRRLESRFADLKRRAHSTTTELTDSKEYIFAMEGCAVVPGAEPGRVQADQSSDARRGARDHPEGPVAAREKAAAEEAADLARAERVTAEAGEGAARLAEKRNARLADGLKSAKHATDSLAETTRSWRRGAGEREGGGGEDARGAARGGGGGGSDGGVAGVCVVDQHRDVVARGGERAVRDAAEGDGRVREAAVAARGGVADEGRRAAEMEASAGRTIQILREKLRRSRKDALRSAVKAK